MTRTGDREIGVVSVRPPDNSGEGWHVCHWINHYLHVVVKY